MDFLESVWWVWGWSPGPEQNFSHPNYPFFEGLKITLFGGVKIGLGLGDPPHTHHADFKKINS